LKADWSRAFDDPITLSDGRELLTLCQAGEYITTLPEAEHDAPHWQLAMRMLIDAATRGGIVMLAEIALRRAINQGKPKPAPEPRTNRAKGYKILRSKRVL
jgi:hypothetical protein